VPAVERVLLGDLRGRGRRRLGLGLLAGSRLGRLLLGLDALGARRRL